VETRNADGSLEISFPDGSVKQVSSDGAELMSFADGTKVEVNCEGDRTLHLANGEREIHTTEYKVRMLLY
jgi:centromere protein J